MALSIFDGLQRISSDTEDILISVSDAVEDFVLDDAFDYDNVVLTPKYTIEEMATFHEIIHKCRENQMNTNIEVCSYYFLTFSRFISSCSISSM